MKTTTRYLALAALLFPSLAHASTFHTAEAAASATLGQLLAQPKTCVEYAGVVFRLADGSYQPTDPVKGQEASFKLAVLVPAGASIAAIYHTHPGCSDVMLSREFSSDDMAMADDLGVPSYIGIAAYHEVREFRPQIGTPYGVLVTKFPTTKTGA